LVTPIDVVSGARSRRSIAVPTREEMQEIEVTSRLYVENGAHYMTATLMHSLRKIFAAASPDQVFVFLDQLLSQKLPLNSLKSLAA
jgi:hypothetical protein